MLLQGLIKLTKMINDNVQLPSPIVLSSCNKSFSLFLRRGPHGCDGTDKLGHQLHSVLHNESPVSKHI